MKEFNTEHPFPREHWVGDRYETSETRFWLSDEVLYNE